MRGDGGVAGEGRVVGVPKFHSWGKCTMPLSNINSDWMSNASSGLRIMLFIYIFILRGSFNFFFLNCASYNYGQLMTCTDVTKGLKIHETKENMRLK